MVDDHKVRARYKEDMRKSKELDIMNSTMRSSKVMRKQVTLKDVVNQNRLGGQHSNSRRIADALNNWDKFDTTIGSHLYTPDNHSSIKTMGRSRAEVLATATPNDRFTNDLIHIEASAG